MYPETMTCTYENTVHTPPHYQNPILHKRQDPVQKWDFFQQEISP